LSFLRVGSKRRWLNFLFIGILVISLHDCVYFCFIWIETIW
jgi:hypothetical protein